MKNSPDDVGRAAMWFGHAMEAIYIVLGTVLVASVVGILVYN
jgi:hypothetical protein